LNFYPVHVSIPLKLKSIFIKIAKSEMLHIAPWAINRCVDVMLEHKTALKTLNPELHLNHLLFLFGLSSFSNGSLTFLRQEESRNPAAGTYASHGFYLLVL
jgi:hypothetical protein